MAIPVSLRGDFKASQLRALARKTKDGPQARRLLALAAIYDGATRTEAARIGGVTLQIIRDWVMRFNARGACGLLDGKSQGQPTRLNDVQRQAIVRMIESGPVPAIMPSGARRIAVAKPTREPPTMIAVLGVCARRVMGHSISSRGKVGVDAVLHQSQKAVGVFLQAEG
jgi:Winged helix-turn helix